MATIEDLDRRVEALEMDLPTRRGFVAHLHDLDTKFQRLEEGQQRHEHELRRLNSKVDEGFERLEQKLDALLAHSKINLD